MTTCTIEPTTTAPAMSENRTLTAHDRCDACGARAYVEVGFQLPHADKASYLLFCGHHYTKHEPMLIGHPHRTTVLDDRAALWEQERSRSNRSADGPGFA